ncbi:MAG: efflux RND transporter periplasmic adaptor subunit [Methylocystaceae bacterium]
MPISKRVTAIILIVFLVLPLMISGCNKKKAVEKESELSVKVASVRIQDISKSGVYSGVVKGKTEAVLYPKASARVTAVLVQSGQTVKKGQQLIALDPNDASIGLAQAQAGYDLALANQKATNMKVESARLDYERTKKLYEAGAASPQKLEADKVAYEGLLTGSSEATLAQSAAALQSAEDRSNITSPIDGVVGFISLAAGDTANPASAAAVVSNTTELGVDVMVSESDVGYIEQNSPVEVTITAADSKPFSGIVDSVATAADPIKRTYLVKIKLANTEGKVRSGMFAQVSLSTLTRKGVLCVPVSAVVPKGVRTVVYTVDKDNRAQEIEVTPGIESRDYVEIIKGLSAGQVVITKGNTLVSKGTLVRVVAGEGK